MPGHPRVTRHVFLSFCTSPNPGAMSSRVEWSSRRTRNCWLVRARPSARHRDERRGFAGVPPWRVVKRGRAVTRAATRRRSEEYQGGKCVRACACVGTALVRIGLVLIAAPLRRRVAVCGKGVSIDGGARGLPPGGAGATPSRLKTYFVRHSCTKLRTQAKHAVHCFW